MKKEKSIIEVKNLSKQFNKLKAVNEISFDVKKGEVFAFLGPNGAGKTTTVRMLTTLLTPTSGTISINGFNPRTNQDEARHSFGIVFQDPSLDDELTAYENMDFHAVFYNIPKNLRKERIKELLIFVELWERKDEFVKNFSGGMKRRLEIARGLLHHPKILFLDEPTIGLDPQTRKHMWQYVMELNKKEKMTIFLTTHYIEEAQKVSDRVAIIDHGKIIRIGTSKELEKSTKTNSLEEAFLKLTGHQIREEHASIKDEMRKAKKMWHR
jgi:ABC-2 type transport system ATP-binding protein